MYYEGGYKKINMNNSKIKQIESLRERLGLKEKPVVTDAGILFIAGFLSLNGFKTHISDGLVNKGVFLSPCIVLELKKKPKIRFKNQASLFEKYLALAKRRSIKQLDNNHYRELMSLARKNGETKEYVEWRKDSVPKIVWLKNLLNEYNKGRKSLDKRDRFSILEFEDGTIRLNFGDTTNENLEKSNVKPSLADKKKKLNQFLGEFKEFKKYLIKNE